MTNGLDFNNHKLTIVANSLEYVDHLFTQTGIMPFLAALALLFGALEPLAYFAGTPYENPLWGDISGVPYLCGPGAFFSWLLSVNTIMLDVYYDKKELSWYVDKSRLIYVLGYALYATISQVILGWKQEFGPSYTALRYITDKAFQAAGILYLCTGWKNWLKFKDLEKKPPLDRGPLKEHPINALVAVIFFLAWSIGRVIEHGHESYTVPPQHPQYWHTWKAIPREYRPVAYIFGIIIGLVTTRGTLVHKLQYGFVKMVWISFVILHSGLFGTIKPLRLTDKSPYAPEELLPFLFVAISLSWQYMTKLFKKEESQPPSTPARLPPNSSQESLVTNRRL